MSNLLYKVKRIYLTVNITYIVLVKIACTKNDFQYTRSFEYSMTFKIPTTRVLIYFITIIVRENVS